MAGVPIAHDHDRRYRYLFSHPGFVERLLTSFVDERFVDELDFSTLERVNASFVSEEFARREADVIWKLSFRGRPVYLFLLIEFQSSVDRWMALRFLRYVAEFYQSLVAEGQTPPLPSVLRSCSTPASRSGAPPAQPASSSVRRSRTRSSLSSPTTRSW